MAETKGKGKNKNAAKAQHTREYHYIHDMVGCALDLIETTMRNGFGWEMTLFR